MSIKKTHEIKGHSHAHYSEYNLLENIDNNFNLDSILEPHRIIKTTTVENQNSQS